MGLDKWFEQQLNPQKIDNSQLQTRLAQYPAMQMSQAGLMARFPNTQMIRAISNGLGRMPSNPIEHAIYADQMYFYSQFKGKLGAQAAPVGPAPTMNAPAAAAENGMQPAMADGNDMAAGSMAPITAPITAPSATAKKENGKKAMLAQAVTRDGAAMPREDAEAIMALPPQQRFDKILSLQPKELLAFRESAGARGRGRILEGLTPEQREILGALGNSRQIIVGELYATNLLRDVYSTHQLQEVMTDFWLNHFNIYIRKNEITPYQLSSYERDVIAPHALGKFEDLLVATAKSPAMLNYLDNWQSTGPDSLSVKRGGYGGNNPDAQRFANNQGRLANNEDAKAQIATAQQFRASKGLNENYGRELMELHTLGVNGGYTQKDVTEVAKVFTGWTIDRPYRGGGYIFDARRHQPGPKTVLGQTIPESGELEGMTVLHMLATSPQTAHFIAQELAVRFVADVPSTTLVDRMAATFLSTNGDIKEVLRTMYKSPEFWSKDVYPRQGEDAVGVCALGHPRQRRADAFADPAGDRPRASRPAGLRRSAPPRATTGAPRTG